MSARVSVVVRTYNRVEYLREAIESVLAQTFRDFDLIVADDGSTDSTPAMLERYRGVLMPLVLPRQGNPAATFNAGVRAAGGELVAFLDDDDVWLPNKLARQIALLDAESRFGFAYGNAQLRDPDGGLSPPALTPDQIVAGSVLRAVVRNMCIHPSTLIVRRCWLDRIGPLDEAIPAAETLFCLQLARATEGVCVPEPVCLIRRHDAQVSRADRHSSYETTIVGLEALLRERSLPLPVRLEAHHAIARHETHLAREMLQRHAPRAARRHVLRALWRYPLHRPAWRWALRSLRGQTPRTTIGMSTREKDGGWMMRPYAPSDEVEARALFARVFGREMPAEVWRWKLGDRTGAVESRWVAATSTGQVVAHYAGVPLRLKIQGSIRTAMISADVMSAPEHQKKGIQTALFPVVYSAWRAAGVAMSWAMPSNRWGSLLEAMGWVNLVPLQWLRVPLHIEHRLARYLGRPRSVAGLLARLAGFTAAAGHRRRRRQLEPGAGLQIEEVSRATSDFDRLWNNVQGSYENVVVRDRAWISWRYLDAPSFGYRVLLARAAGEPAGYVVYRCIEEQELRTGLIVDLFTAPGARSVALPLLGAALDALWQQGAEVARALAPVHSPVDGLLRAAGFAPASDPFAFTAVIFDSSISLARLRDPKSWLLCGGDFDTV